MRAEGERVDAVLEGAVEKYADDHHRLCASSNGHKCDCYASWKPENVLAREVVRIRALIAHQPPQTQYGFDWGPVVIERIAHIEGRGYCISIRSKQGYTGPEIQVLVSEKGRSVTAYPLRGAKVKPSS